MSTGDDNSSSQNVISIFFIHDTIDLAFLYDVLNFTVVSLPCLAFTNLPLLINIISQTSFYVCFRLLFSSYELCVPQNSTVFRIQLRAHFRLLFVNLIIYFQEIAQVCESIGHQLGNWLLL